MSKVFQFGEQVTGYDIPVLNEREIRAAAGMLFLATFISLVMILSKGNFIPIKYVITIFLTDFLIRVFVNPKYSPSLILGRLVVRNQVPEYVGAPQKKFAWAIGVALAGTMFILMVVMNTFSIITGLICLVCLLFLFFESAFGICLGCKFYPIFFKDKVQYCPGEVCDIKSRQEIQKTSGMQLLILLALVLYITGLSFTFHETFKQAPHELFSGKSLDSAAQAEQNK